MSADIDKILATIQDRYLKNKPSKNMSWRYVVELEVSGPIRQGTGVVSEHKGYVIGKAKRNIIAGEKVVLRINTLTGELRSEAITFNERGSKLYWNILFCNTSAEEM